MSTTIHTDIEIIDPMEALRVLSTVSEIDVQALIRVAVQDYRDMVTKTLKSLYRTKSDLDADPAGACLMQLWVSQNQSTGVAAKRVPTPLVNVYHNLTIEDLPQYAQVVTDNDRYKIVRSYLRELLTGVLTEFLKSSYLLQALTINAKHHEVQAIVENVLDKLADDYDEVSFNALFDKFHREMKETLRVRLKSLEIFCEPHEIDSLTVDEMTDVVKDTLILLGEKTPQEEAAARDRLVQCFIENL